MVLSFPLARMTKALRLAFVAFFECSKGTHWAIMRCVEEENSCSKSRCSRVFCWCGIATREVLSLLVRRGTVSSWYLIARRVLQYQITIY